MARLSWHCDVILYVEFGSGSGSFGSWPDRARRVRVILRSGVPVAKAGGEGAARSLVDHAICLESIANPDVRFSPQRTRGVNFSNREPVSFVG